MSDWSSHVCSSDLNRSSQIVHLIPRPRHHRRRRRQPDERLIGPMSIVFIVFLPLLAAVIAGLGNKALGKVPAKLVTTGALFISCALSWPIFLRSEEHTSELQSLMRISYAVVCLKKKKF